jgi:hypothetical protein
MQQDILKSGSARGPQALGASACGWRFARVEDDVFILALQRVHNHNHYIFIFVNKHKDCLFLLFLVIVHDYHS